MLKKISLEAVLLLQQGVLVAPQCAISTVVEFQALFDLLELLVLGFVLLEGIRQLFVLLFALLYSSLQQIQIVLGLLSLTAVFRL